MNRKQEMGIGISFLFTWIYMSLLSIIIMLKIDGRI